MFENLVPTSLEKYLPDKLETSEQVLAHLSRRRVPWSTVLITTLCLSCHVAAFYGVSLTAGGFTKLSRSAVGWGDVGENFANSLETEFDEQLYNVAQDILKTVDGAMKAELDVARFIEAAQAAISWDPALAKFSGAINSSEYQAMKGHFDDVVEKLDTFLPPLQSVLTKAANWTREFTDNFNSSKMSSKDMFVDSIDKALDIFSEVLNFIQGDEKNSLVLVDGAFDLFDVSNDGNISKTDLDAIASIFKISWLIGNETADIIAEFDSDGDGVLNKEEFTAFAQSDRMPGVTSLTLQGQSNVLSAIGTRVLSARTREEVSTGVVEYIKTVAIRNDESAAWVASTLVNGSLPVEFTASVLAQMCLMHTDEDILNSFNIEQRTCALMLSHDKMQTRAAFEQMAMHDWWLEQGFPVSEFEGCIETVGNWFLAAANSSRSQPLVTWQEPIRENATVRRVPEMQEAIREDATAYRVPEIFSPPGAPAAGSPSKAPVDTSLDVSDADASDVTQFEGTARSALSLLATQTHANTASSARMWSVMSSNLVATARRSSVEASVRTQLQQLARRKAALTSPLARRLPKSLFNTRTPSVNATQTYADQALKSGVPALPESLAFAQELGSNATSRAKDIITKTFDHTSKFIDKLDTVMDDFRGVVEHVKSFLDMVEDWATPAGQERLQVQLQNFSKFGFEKFISYMENNFDIKIDRGPLALTEVDQHVRLSNDIDDWLALAEKLLSINKILPLAATTLTQARQTVSSMSGGLGTRFGLLGDKGGALFETIGAHYEFVFATYCAVFFLTAIWFLFYNFWACGWFGGPCAVSTDLPSARPTTLGGRFMSLIDAVHSEIKEANNDHFSFWGMLLFFQTFLLIFYTISNIIVVLTTAYVIVGAGCDAMPLLMHHQPCNSALSALDSWLPSFLPGRPLSYCTDNELLVCKVMSDGMVLGSKITGFFSLMAVVLTYQLLIDSAVLHERSRWSLALSRRAKELKQISDEPADAPSDEGFAMAPPQS